MSKTTHLKINTRDHLRDDLIINTTSIDIHCGWGEFQEKLSKLYDWSTPYEYEFIINVHCKTTLITKLGCVYSKNFIHIKNASDWEEFMAFCVTLQSTVWHLWFFDSKKADLCEKVLKLDLFSNLSKNEKNRRILFSWYNDD